MVDALNTARNRVERAQRELSAALVALEDALKEQEPTRPPSLPELVLGVLREHGGGPMTATEIYEVLAARGQAPPHANPTQSVRVTLQRAMDRKAVKRVGPATYVLANKRSKNRTTR